MLVLCLMFNVSDDFCRFSKYGVKAVRCRCRMKNDVYNLVYTFKLCNLYVKCSFQGSRGCSTCELLKFAKKPTASSETKSSKNQQNNSCPLRSQFHQV